MKTKTPLTIKCKECETVFSPDVKVQHDWSCPKCNGMIFNMVRHYRAIADVFIIASLICIGLIAYWIATKGMSLKVVLVGLHLFALVPGIFFIYASATPWRETKVHVLVWMVFGSPILLFLVPFLLTGNVGGAVSGLYVLIIPYLFQLNSEARKFEVIDSSSTEN